MLTPAYSITKFSEKFSEINTFKDLCHVLKEQNLTAQINFGELVLHLPSLELDGLDTKELFFSVSSKRRDLATIDLMPLPGSFSLKDCERMLLDSLRGGIEEIVQKH